jgi:hypothetical protein
MLVFKVLGGLLFMPKKNYTIYQIKVTLNNSHPPIWRRLQVPDNTTLLKLHDILQIVMGWTDSHLHEFTINGETYGDPENDELGFRGIKREERFKLSQVLHSEGQKFTYDYDFGDSWEHILLVEKIIPPEAGAPYPRCIKGKRACPPEDVGGVWGYAHFLEALNDPEHPEHDQYFDWAGGEFDPETFDIDEVNAILGQMGRGRSAAAQDNWTLQENQPIEMESSLLSGWLQSLSEEQQRTAENLPLRRDMVILLSYLRDNKVVGTQSTGNFPLQAVYEICAHLTNPPVLDDVVGDHVYRTHTEEDVWPLYFMHLLASIAGLVLGGVGIRWRLSPLGETYLTISPALQVHLLFQTWWRQINWAIASPYGYQDGYMPYGFTTITLKNLLALSDMKWTPIEPFAGQIIKDAGLGWISSDPQSAYRTLQWIVARVVVDPLHELGVLEVEYTPQTISGSGYQQVSTIRISPLGRTLLSTVSNKD